MEISKDQLSGIKNGRTWISFKNIVFGRFAMETRLSFGKMLGNKAQN